MTTYVKHKMCNIVSGSGKECDKPMGHKGMCINKTGCIVAKWGRTSESRLMVVDIYCYVNIQWLEINEIEFDKTNVIVDSNMDFGTWNNIVNNGKIFTGTDM